MGIMGRLVSADLVYQQTLTRDEHRCTACGSTQRLVVHHRDGKGRGCKKPNHSLDNLETLCNSCHNKWHSSKRVHKQVSDLLGTMSLRAIAREIGVSHTTVRNVRDELETMEGI